MPFDSFISKHAAAHCLSRHRSYPQPLCYPYYINHYIHPCYSCCDCSILHQMRPQHHLPSAQTFCLQRKQTINCVRPLMLATDAKPRSQTRSCLRTSPPTSYCLPLFVFYLYEMKKMFCLFAEKKITERVMMKPARAFGLLSLRRQETHSIP